MAFEVLSFTLFLLTYLCTLFFRFISYLDIGGYDPLAIFSRFHLITVRAAFYLVELYQRSVCLVAGVIETLVFTDLQKGLYRSVTSVDHVLQFVGVSVQRILSFYLLTDFGELEGRYVVLACVGGLQSSVPVISADRIVISRIFYSVALAAERTSIVPVKLFHFDFQSFILLS